MCGSVNLSSHQPCSMTDQASECLGPPRLHTHMNTDTHRVASSALSTTHTEGGAGLGVGVSRLGVDVALITVQVEIVSGIDCASKCYTSHLSIFSFFFFNRRPVCHLQRSNCECKLTNTISQSCLITCENSSQATNI